MNDVLIDTQRGHYHYNIAAFEPFDHCLGDECCLQRKRGVDINEFSAPTVLKRIKMNILFPILVEDARVVHNVLITKFHAISDPSENFTVSLLLISF